MIVYTTVFGRTDPLHEPMAKGDARFICFTDQPIESKGWEIVRVERKDAPTRSSRMMKALSHRYFPDEEWVLWMDANFTLMVDPELLKVHGEFVNFVHRDRRRISDEWREIARLGKAKPETLQAQLAAYQADGFDTDAHPMTVLSCNGVILRRQTQMVRAINDAWAEEMERFTLRDQMCLDYVCWKHGYSLGKWPGFHNENPYFRFTHYKRPTNDF